MNSSPRYFRINILCVVESVPCANVYLYLRSHALAFVDVQVNTQISDVEMYYLEYGIRMLVSD